MHSHGPSCDWEPKARKENQLRELESYGTGGQAWVCECA
jgi:hypothetical protein